MKEIGGVRHYNVWAGNPNGREEDKTRCIKEVYSKFNNYQCCRKRGHGPNGLYCKQHNPITIKAKEDAEETKYQAQRKRNQESYDRSQFLEELAKNIETKDLHKYKLIVDN